MKSLAMKSTQPPRLPLAPRIKTLLTNELDLSVLTLVVSLTTLLASGILYTNKPMTIKSNEVATSLGDCELDPCAFAINK